MLKFLKGVVGSGGGIKDLPYNLGDAYSEAWGAWTHYRGTSKDDGASVSIFSLVGNNSQDSRLAAARNGIKRLRMVRHPNVLSFLHTTEVETNEGGLLRPTIYLVTEPVTPLSEKLRELSLQGSQRDEYYAWGLHQIAKAVSFLNNDNKLVHGNVCLSSVVVTPTLDWKLHAFDVLSEFDGQNPAAEGPMIANEWLVGSQYKPAELGKNDWSTIRKSPPWAIDSWGLGCFIQELFSGSKLLKTEDLRNTVSIPKTLLPDYQRLLNSAPARRLNSAKLIENSEYFHNKLVETIQFMETLNLKDTVDKDSFFRKLPNLVDQLPREIVTKKLLPMLASALEFGSAAAPALTPLLKMGSWLSPDDFNVKILPTVVKLFASNDRAIRVGLLQQIDQFGSSLSTQVVDEQIFSHLATGFSDTSAFLRELTLKSMLTLAPKLSQRTITGALLKYLSKLQVDEEPAIRTNTTILLGNIASYLNEATRKRVLINAFTVRALRDGFGPARGAGIMALMATSEYYDATEVATRILPHLVALTVDADSDVRAKAFHAADVFLQQVKKYHAKVESGDGTSTGAGAAPSTSVANSGLLGWAVSSFATKTKGPEQSSTTTGVVMQANVTSAVHPAAVMSGNPLASKPATEPSLSSHTDSSAHLIPDGWGEIEADSYQAGDDDKTGWEDLITFDEPPPPALVRIQAAQQRPVASTRTPAIPPPPPDSFSSKQGDDLFQSTTKTSNGWGDDNDDDPWAAIAAPPPSTTAKPLYTAAPSVSGRGVGIPKVRQVPHVSIGGGRGRGRAAPAKLGVQRLNRPTD